MKWYRELYISENLYPDSRKVIDKIRKGKFTPGIYLIALPQNEENMLDVYPLLELRQKYYKKKELYVVGIARGYDEAIELVSSMVMDVYEATKDANVKKYIRGQNDWN